MSLLRHIGYDVWRLGAPLRYYSDLFSAILEVPSGFETDFASIPRAFHWLLPKNGDYDAAAVLHDWLYETGIYHKDTADKIFLEAMTCLGVEPWKRQAMYRAVVMFGFKAWNDHRNSERVQ